MAKTSAASPQNGPCASRSGTAAARPPKPLRMSVRPTANQPGRPEGRPIIAAAQSPAEAYSALPRRGSRPARCQTRSQSTQLGRRFVAAVEEAARRQSPTGTSPLSSLRCSLGGSPRRHLTHGWPLHCAAARPPIPKLPAPLSRRRSGASKRSTSFDASPNLGIACCPLSRQ